jgi:hypothetical protein
MERCFWLRLGGSGTSLRFRFFSCVAELSVMVENGINSGLPCINGSLPRIKYRLPRKKSELPRNERPHYPIKESSQIRTTIW